MKDATNWAMCDACGGQRNLSPANHGDQHICTARQWAAETNRLLRAILTHSDHSRNILDGMMQDHRVNCLGLPAEPPTSNQDAAPPEPERSSTESAEPR